MTDHYGQVEVQLEQMKSFSGDAEKDGVQSDDRAKASSTSASVSPDPSNITAAGRDACSDPSHRRKNRCTMGKQDKNSNSDPSLYGSVVSAHVRKNLNRLEHERTLQIKGTGKILQGKSESNGNFVTIQPSKNTLETRRDDGRKVARKRRPVTVDTAKAKTSLEALKLSIKQLKWKEVCYTCVVLSCGLSW